MPIVTIPDYRGEDGNQVTIDFPDDMNDEEITQVIDRDYPDPKKIFNPDGSSNIDTSQLIDQPDQPVFTTGEKLNFAVRNAPIIRDAMSKFNELAISQDKRMKKEAKIDLEQRISELTAEDIERGISGVGRIVGSVPKAIPEVVQGVGGFVAGVGAAGFDGMVQLLRGDPDFFKAIADLDPKQMVKAQERVQNAVVEAFPQLKSEDGRLWAETLATPFTMYEEQAVAPLAKWAGEKFGNTDEEKANIEAWVHLGGDVAILGVPKLLRTIKEGKLAAQHEILMEEQARSVLDIGERGPVGGPKRPKAKVLDKQLREEKVRREEREAELAEEVTAEEAREAKQVREAAEAELVGREEDFGIKGPEGPKVTLEKEPAIGPPTPKGRVKGATKASKKRVRELKRGADKVIKKVEKEEVAIKELEREIAEQQKELAREPKLAKEVTLPKVEESSLVKGLQETLIDPDASVAEKLFARNKLKKLGVEERKKGFKLGEEGAIRLPFGRKKSIEQTKETLDVLKMGRGVKIPGTPELEPFRLSTKKGAQVLEMNKQRGANIQKATFDSEIFIRNTLKGLTLQELEAMPFTIQKTKAGPFLEKIGRQDLAPLIDNPTPKMKVATKQVTKYLDEAVQFFKDNGVDVNVIDNYITQIWETTKKNRQETGNFFIRTSPFTKKRKFPTWKEGIEAGKIPRTLSIKDLLRTYDQFKIKSVFNNKYAEAVAGLTDGLGNKLIQSRSPRKEMLKKLEEAGHNFNDWPEIEHPSLNRALFIGVTKKGAPLITKIPVKVHPEIFNELNLIFGKRFVWDINLPFLRGKNLLAPIEIIGAFAKKGNLSFSLFHGGVLLETAIADGIGIKALKLWNPFAVYRALQHGDFAIFKNQKIAKDAIDHGVTFTAIEDVQRNRVQKAFLSAEKVTKNTPVVGKLIRGVRKGNDLWDRGLWDHYHNTIKLYAYEHNISQSLKFAEQLMNKEKGRSLTIKEIEVIKNREGRLVNDKYGGQNWELKPVLGNPKMRQLLQMLYLSPDWQISTINQAIAYPKGKVISKQARRAKKKGRITEEEFTTRVLEGQVLSRNGKKFMIRAAIYFTVIANLINYTLTKKDKGEGRMIWENPEDRKFDIYMGKNNDGPGGSPGTDRYLRLGKQFREPWNWITDFMGTAGGKLAPLPKELSRQWNKTDPGSGFPTPFQEESLTTLESLTERGKSIGEAFLPFSLRPHIQDRPGMFMLVFPTNRGMTSFKARKQFKAAIKDGDIDRIRRTYVAAVENGFNGEKLFKEARTQVKSDITYDDKTFANEILDELLILAPDFAAQSDLIMGYSSRGLMTPNVVKQLGKLIEEQKEIKKQQRQLKAIQLKGGDSNQHTNRVTPSIGMSVATPNSSLIEKLESSGDPKAVSRSGAVGPMQLLHGTFNDYAKVSGARPSQIINPTENRKAGRWYLEKELPRLLGSKGVSPTLLNVVAAYNWGPSNLSRWVKKNGNVDSSNVDKLPNETRNYVKAYQKGGR